MQKVPKNNFSKTYTKSNVCSRYFYCYTRNMMNKINASPNGQIEVEEVIDVNRRTIGFSKTADNDNFES